MFYFKPIMTSRKEGQYGRLADDEDSETADIHIHPGFHRKSYFLSWSLVANVILALLVVGLLVRTLSQPSASTTSTHYTGVGPVQLLEDQLGLTSKVIKTYEFFEEDLDDEDFARGDPYWASLFPYGGGQAFLDDEVIASYKLPPSIRYPPRGNQTLYEMAGYHSLHCLSSLRQVIGRYVAAHKHGEQYDIPAKEWDHTLHCLADIRQALLCNLDETLMTISNDIHPGYQQKKVCKDLRPISEWLEYNFEGKFGGNFDGE